MVQHAHALPAGPGSHPSTKARRRPDTMPENTELVFNVLVAERPDIAALHPRTLRVLKAIYGYVGRNAYGFPSQARLGRSAGYTDRTIRTALAELRRAGFVFTWEKPRDDGTRSTLRYAWGPAAHAAFAYVASRYPRRPLEGRAKPLPRRQPRPSPPEVSASAPAEIQSSGPAEKRSADPDQNSSNSFLCGSAPEAVDAPEQNLEVLISSEDREVACEALTIYERRRHPKRAPPSWFDAARVALVASRSAQTAGARDAKLEALRHAIAGAFVASSSRPPTTSYIFGKQEHYLAHVERGRAKAEGDARAARARAEGPTLPPRPATRAESLPSVDTRPPHVVAFMAALLAGEPQAPPPRALTDAEVRAEVERELAAALARRPSNDSGPFREIPGNGPP